MPRIGTLITLSPLLPIIDSSATISAIFSRIAWRTFCRCRWRSPALRSERNASDCEYGRMVPIGSPPFLFVRNAHFKDHVSSLLISQNKKAVQYCSLNGSRKLIFPKIIGRVLEYHIHAMVTVTAFEQLLNHRVVLLTL